MKYEAGDEIPFHEVQVGDQIRRTYRLKDGTSSVTEGVVSAREASMALSKSGYFLAGSGDDDVADVMIELVARPEIPLWERAEVGDLIIGYRESLMGKKWCALYHKTAAGWRIPAVDEFITLDRLKKYLAEEERIELRKCHNVYED